MPRAPLYPTVPRYTFRDDTTGDQVTIEWLGDGEPTDEDIEEAFQEQRAEREAQSAKAQPRVLSPVEGIDEPIDMSAQRRVLRENAPAIAGTVASLATGGLGAIPAMAATGLATAGTAKLTGNVDPGTAGITSAAMEGVSRAIPPLANLTGRALYRAGALPVKAMFDKYGPIAKTGVEKGILATQGGVEKVTQLRNVAQAEKAAKLASAAQNVSYRPQQIVMDIAKKLAPDAAMSIKAQEGNPIPFYVKKLKGFLQENPALNPESAEAIKKFADDRLGLAYRKVREKAPLTPREDFRKALSQVIGDTQESMVSGYKQLNKEIMDTEGLRRVIARRVGPGANQGLENALTGASVMFNPAKALMARLAMLPPVLTGAGIATDRIGRYTGYGTGQALRAALLNLMQQSKPPEE